MALSDFQTKVDDLLRDEDDQVSTTQRDNAIMDAVLEYSKRKPDTKVEDVTGDGTRLLDLPAGWEDNFSYINSIEYPIGDVPPTLLDDWSLYESPGEVQIQLNTAIASGEDARVNYAIRHTLNVSADTIPVTDREAVANYAAAVCLEQLASLYSGDQDPTIAADSVNHASKSQRYASRAKTLRQRFYDQIGVDPKKNVAAGVVVNLDQKDTFGQDRLTHSNRYR